MTQLYRMDDRPGAKSKAATPLVDEGEARYWNTPERGFGVFRTVNTFDGPRRKEFLGSIDAWAIDIDEGSKAEQRKRIMASPLVPSSVVETKRGFQVYWTAKPGAQAAHWNSLMVERLVPYFGADANARDLSRILRMPGFLHLKDPADPFLCREVWRHDVSYTERQIASAFPWKPDPKARAAEQRAEVRKVTRVDAGEDFWAAIAAIDCRDALLRLSGSRYVNGQSFSFRRTSRNHWNLFVDGEGTSCFVDERGRIGSNKGGGPLITNWLRFPDYGNDWKTTLQAVMEIYPHIAEIDQRNKQREHQQRRAA